MNLSSFNYLFKNTQQSTACIVLDCQYNISVFFSLMIVRFIVHYKQMTNKPYDLRCLLEGTQKKKKKKNYVLRQQYILLKKKKEKRKEKKQYQQQIIFVILSYSIIEYNDIYNPIEQEVQSTWIPNFFYLPTKQTKRNKNKNKKTKRRLPMPRPKN